MTQEYLEAILVWKANGPSESVNQWLADTGLNTMPMRRGLLISGDRKQFERAFQVKLEGQALPASLPIPPGLHDIVSSITVLKPPEYRHQQREVG